MSDYNEIRNYPPYEKIASREDLKKYYNSARKEIINYKNMARASDAITHSYAKQKNKWKEEAKSDKRKVLQLTKKQKAKDEARKAGYWSGAATIGVTILYETWKVIGFPGGSKWMEWWSHEAVYGVIVWCTTITLGWFYKQGHEGS